MVYVHWEHTIGEKILLQKFFQHLLYFYILKFAKIALENAKRNFRNLIYFVLSALRVRDYVLVPGF